jgi:hypothetical protein
MSLAPEIPQDPKVTRRRLRLPYPRLWTLFFAIFALEIGAFLVVFPWMDSWTLNHFPTFVPALEGLWDDPYFKGAVSGLGLVNLYVAASQLVAVVRKRA